MPTDSNPATITTDTDPLDVYWASVLAAEAAGIAEYNAGAALTDAKFVASVSPTEENRAAATAAESAYHKAYWAAQAAQERFLAARAAAWRYGINVNDLP